MARYILGRLISLIFILFVVSLMTRFFGSRRSLADGLRVWKFALFAAFAMTVPYVLLAHLLGPEFPSIFGGLVGLAIVVPAAKRGLFMPAREDCWEFAPRSQWEPAWTGSIEVRDIPHRHGRMPMALAWAPYVLVGALLVVTRLRTLPIGAWLQSWTIEMPGLLGTDISIRVQPLYLPGTIFIVVAAVTFLGTRISSFFWTPKSRIKVFVPVIFFALPQPDPPAPTAARCSSFLYA